MNHREIAERLNFRCDNGFDVLDQRRLVAKAIKEAHAAGRDAGLEEGAEVAENYEPDISGMAGVNDMSIGHEAGQQHASEEISAAIRALKGGQSATAIEREAGGPEQAEKADGG